MTILTGIKMKNFKSFKKAEVPFAHGFTAIAGANGSGKSNILDAILFAMGATSLKMLRVSKLIELVNQDSADGYAKVELTLNSKGKSMAITRIIDRQGRSVFKVDEKKKTLNEIQSLLLELGVNPGGHNIVVQGDITRVIEMNARQRLQVIEEAAGLAEFEEKKDEALKKLDQVEQKVKEALLILNEREAYLRQIEQDRNNALHCTGLTSELKSSKATIVGEELRLTRLELDRAKEKMAAIGKEIDAARQEKARAQEEEFSLEKKVEGITRSLIEAGEKTYSVFGKDLEQRRGHINLLNERLQGRAAVVESLVSEEKALREELTGLDRSKKEKEAQLSDARKGLAKTAEDLNALRGAIQSKGPEYEKRKSELAAMEVRAAQMGVEIEQIREIMHITLLQKHGIERELRAAQQSAGELEAARQRLDERLRLKKEAEKNVQVLSGQDPEGRLAAKEKEAEKLSSESSHMRGIVESLSASLSAIGKARGECPTCDKPLEKSLREKLIAKRGREIEDLRQKAKAMEAGLERLNSEKPRLMADAKALSEGIAIVKSLRGVEDELSAVKQKLQAGKDPALLKKLSELQAKEAELKKKTDSMERERESARVSIEEFRKADSSAQIGQLLARLHELTERKGEFEKLLAKLSAEIEHSITGRKSSILGEIAGIEKGLAQAREASVQLLKEKDETEIELKKLEAELEKASQANRVLEDEKGRLTGKIAKVSQEREKLSAKAEALEREINELNIAQSRNFVRISDLEDEVRDYSGVEPLARFNLTELKKRIPEIEAEISKIGPVNMKALSDYAPFKAEVDQMRERSGQLDEERKAVLEMIDKINVRKFSVFMECFSQVSRKFSELYYNFFEGEGLLSLTDEVNPFDGGLMIQAKHKQDALKNIDAMSGGEKSLTALAFLFAIQSFEAAPFYILDEVDAALDKGNSIKVAGMIKGMSSASQFVAISHNDSVINQADQIIGVALNRQKSSVIGLRLSKGGAPLISNDGPQEGTAGA